MSVPRVGPHTDDAEGVIVKKVVFEEKLCDVVLSFGQCDGSGCRSSKAVSHFVSKDT